MSDSIEHLGVTDAELADAYIYLLGRYLVIRQEGIDLAEPGVDYNVIKHNPARPVWLRFGGSANVREPESRRCLLRGVACSR